MNHYLRCSPSADASGFDTIARSGYANVGVSGLGEVIADIWKPYYDPADSSFDYVLLEANVAGAWIYVWSNAITTVPTGSGTYAKASGVCFSGKDTANKNFPVYAYEIVGGGGSFKANSYAVLSVAAKWVANQYFNAGGTANEYAPVAWRVSRGSVFSQRWLALVQDSNQKLRRLRNIT
jgi:hypothetical protein